MASISQKFSFYSHPAEMEPLLPGEHRLGPLLEQAHDLMRSAGRLAGMCQPILRRRTKTAPATSTAAAAALNTGWNAGSPMC
ncbi:hypothetical protein [Pseudorhodoferax sp.]|uniref:hypothetical protein n=1 Tax=Pseudorhodoferax sp. TaxID=1993553 RepID=UPI002DD6261D|nr:hypothetical protein [Pseudorhodoferax sp.]